MSGGRRVLHKKKAVKKPMRGRGVFETDLDYDGGGFFDDVLSGFSSAAQAIGPIAQLVGHLGAGKMHKKMPKKMPKKMHMKGAGLEDDFAALGLDDGGFSSGGYAVGGRKKMMMMESPEEAMRAKIKKMTKAQLQRALIKASK